MSEQLTIAGQGAHIQLIVHRYENMNALNSSDANWLDCSLVFAVGPFTGEIKLALTAYDLEVFSGQLKRLSEGTSSAAELKTDEEVIQCTIAMTTLGHAVITGTIQAYDDVKASLLFSFESDQSFLGKTNTELETMVEKFAVKRLG